LIFVAESDLKDPRLVRSRDSGGYGLQAQWSDDFHHALHTVLTGEREGYYEDFGSMTDLGKALTSSYVYDGRYSVHRGRRHGRRADGLSGNRFVVYSQNHDHIGNRAKGDRMGHLINPGRLKIAAALVLMAPFVPMLFQGEEWGAMSPFLYFTDHGDDGIGEAVTEGRRREFQAFGWKPDEIADPQDPASFERSKLQWNERDLRPHAELLDWHRRLIRLRREAPELSDGRMELARVTVNEDRRWIRMARGSFIVLVNLHSTSQQVPLDGGRPDLLLASEPEIVCTRDGVNLPPDSVAIVRNETDNSR
jgi:maltooligosyltrehalose trehalohydrolase